MRKIIAAFVGCVLSCPLYANTGIWFSDADIAALPASGAAYNAMVADANQTCDAVDLDDNFTNGDQCVLANALYFARSGNTAARDDVVTALTQLSATTYKYPGTSPHNTTALPLGRNLGSYVVAADLISLPTYDAALNQRFKNKLIELRSAKTSGGGSTSLINCSDIRPNNHGTMCTSSRLAVALYLNDAAEVNKIVTITKGWLGDRAAYSLFKFAELDWQANASLPVPVNPQGATKTIGGATRNIDGVLPDDQRRGCTAVWPPCDENYVWEAVQGELPTAIMLENKGYPVFSWSNEALRRVFEWMYTQNNFPASGDDGGMPHVINSVYGTNYRADVPAQPGKNLSSYLDWLFASGGSTPSAGSLQLSGASFSINESGSSLTIDVPRTGGSAGAVTVSYATSNGSASSGSDYVSTSGSLSYADSVTTNSVVIPINEDAVVESNETLTLTLSNPTGGATLGSISSATITIVDNDVAQPVPGQLKFSAVNYDVDEGVGNATVTVSRVNGSDGTVGVSYSTSDDTALAGSDYTAKVGTLTFVNGDTSETISIAITNDTVTLEGNEVFDVDLSNPTGGAVLVEPISTTVTIEDNDTETTVNCLGLPANIVGTEGADTLTGTSNFNDVIAGQGGNDILKGLSGNDTICGGDGNDGTMEGGLGLDNLSGGAGADFLNGGADTDTCNGGAGTDTQTTCESTTNIP